MLFNIFAASNLIFLVKFESRSWTTEQPWLPLLQSAKDKNKQESPALKGGDSEIGVSRDPVLKHEGYYTLYNIKNHKKQKRKIKGLVEVLPVARLAEALDRP